MRTSKERTSAGTGTGSISSQGDSPASPTALLESDWEKRMNATFGPRCSGQSARSGRNGSWARMFSESLVGMTGWYSKRCSLTWKLKDTKSNRTYFRLQVSVHRTAGTGSGLLPTPTATEGQRGRERKLTVVDGRPANISPKGVKYGLNIRQLAEQGFLPAPLASDATTGAIIGRNDYFRITSTGMPRKTNGNGKSGSVGLARLVKLLPTGDTGTGRISAMQSYRTTGQTGQLNPRFVLEMMGFPRTGRH